MKRRVSLVTKKDLVVETFRAGGKGGQAQNKTETGVRITHPPSGAVGEARDSRSQDQNKRAAFRRMVASPHFQVWLDLMTHPEHLKVEVIRNGDWVIES